MNLEKQVYELISLETELKRCPQIDPEQQTIVREALKCVSEENYKTIQGIIESTKRLINIVHDS